MYLAVILYGSQTSVNQMLKPLEIATAAAAETAGENVAAESVVGRWDVDAAVVLVQVAVGSILFSAEVAALTWVSVGAEIVAVEKLVSPWMIGFASTTAAAAAVAVAEA